MAQVDDVVIISLSRFRGLESSEMCLNENIENNDKFIRVMYYSGVRDYYIKNEANRSLIDRIQSLENSNKKLRDELSKNWIKRLFQK